MKYTTKLLWPILMVTLGLGTLNYLGNRAIAQKSAKKPANQPQRSTMLADLEPSTTLESAERYSSANKPSALPEELPPFLNPEDKLPKAMLEDIQPASKLYVVSTEKRKPTPMPDEPKP